MPDDAPRAKLEATRAYGAHVVLYKRREQDRAEIARGICAKTGGTLVAPYDDLDVIAGQGTVALEFLASAGRLDVIVVPVGGGGLLAGCAVATHALAALMQKRVDVTGNRVGAVISGGNVDVHRFATLLEL